MDTSGGIQSIIVAAHEKQPLLYVIDSAPVFLGLFSRLAGVRQDKITEINASLERQVAAQTESLRAALEQAREANQKILHMADHDPLTGLFNRRRFQHELERWTDYAVRYQHSGALVFIDIDSFKSINDTHGHKAGDACLVTIGGLLQNGLRGTDSIGRWGGDEFVILLPEITAQCAVELVQRILQSFETACMNSEETQFRVSASVGIALFPDHARSADELIARADAAMYQSKALGLNRWTLYSTTVEAAG
ncbi:MAG: GGDEF domain-containing protein [Burkholderiales bacterium]|nr:GGDEF domain-containing protein [Burkholderiales bacterium]